MSGLDRRLLQHVALHRLGHQEVVALFAGQQSREAVRETGAHDGDHGGRLERRDEVLQLPVGGVVRVGHHVHFGLVGHRGPAGGQYGQGRVNLVPLLHVGVADLPLLHQPQAAGPLVSGEHVREPQQAEGLHALSADLHPALELQGKGDDQRLLPQGVQTCRETRGKARAERGLVDMN